MRIPFVALLTLFALTLVVTSGVGPLVASAGPPPTHSVPGAGPAAPAIAPSIAISGNWVISTSVTEVGVTISVTGGVLIEAGGTLTLQNVVLLLAEPSALANGIEVRSGGRLVAEGFTFDSLTPANHVWIRADSGSTLSLTDGSITDLGGAVTNEVGLVLESSGSYLSAVRFNDYYSAIAAANAPSTTVVGSFFGNSTSATNSTYAVSVTGASSGFTLTSSNFTIPQGVGALFLASPHARVVGNRFTLDPKSSLMMPILLGSTQQGLDSASYSYFANNSIYGAGIIDSVSSYVTIYGNSVVDTGSNGPYGIMAEVPVGTLPGLWATGLVIENNYISDFSRYGIRLQLNCSNFLVQDNVIVHPSPTPGPAWTVKFGGPQIDGIYVIRGIRNGVVDHNYLDLTDVPAVAVNGMSIESNVQDLKVTNNVFINMTQNGIVVQGNVPGFDNSLPWERGPTLRVLIANNEFLNNQYIQQTNFEVKGILDWLWANYTTVENNTFVNWNQVNTKYYYNGAAFLTDGSYGVYTNNTVEGARWGFVFTNYGALSSTYSGEFNRSDNLVYGNQLFGITQGSVSETPTDGMGPLHNVLAVLDDAAGPANTPGMVLETVKPATSISLSESIGVFHLAVGTANPITGGTQTFVTGLPWLAPAFGVTSTGTVPGGVQSVSVNALNSTAVKYSVPSTATTTESVTVQVPVPPFTALYNVSVSGSSPGTFLVNSTTGPAVFPVGMNGAPTIRVALLSWNETGPNPNGSGPPVTGVYGIVQNLTGVRVAGVPLSLLFSSDGRPSAEVNATAGAIGEFSVGGLNVTGSVSGAIVDRGALPVTGYSFGPAVPGTLNITVTVSGSATSPPPVPPPPGGGNSTALAVVEGHVSDVAGVPVGNASVAIGFSLNGGGIAWVNASTDGSGFFQVLNLHLTGGMTTVEVDQGLYPVLYAHVLPTNDTTLDLMVEIGSAPSSGSVPGWSAVAGLFSSPAGIAAVALGAWGAIAFGLVAQVRGSRRAARPQSPAPGSSRPSALYPRPPRSPGRRWFLFRR